MSKHSYPYDGYIELAIEFPREVVGTHPAVETLALVCPEPPHHQESPILIGTNTNMFVLGQLCQRLEAAKEGDHPTIHTLFLAAYQKRKKEHQR